MRAALLIGTLLAAGAAHAQTAPVPGPQPQRVVRMQAPPPAVSGQCTIVPMTNEAAIPVVEVMIGDKGPYRFAIDTGAGGHGRIKTALAESLELNQVGEARTPAPGGTVAMRPIWGVDRLGVGSLAFEKVQLVAAPDLPGPFAALDGVLGIALFAELTLTLDYGAGRAKIDRAPLGSGMPADFARGAPEIELEVDGRKFTVALDLGNSVSALFLPEADARALPLGGEPSEAGKARTSFGDFSIMVAPLAAPVTAGGTTLPVKTVGWPPARPPGNLGSKGLAGMSVAVDRRSGKVLIAPSGKPLACA